ncbi:hypothetical protein VTO73DRAFT_10304 [Trametes versicolor]
MLVSCHRDDPPRGCIKLSLFPAKGLRNANYLLYLALPRSSPQTAAPQLLLSLGTSTHTASMGRDTITKTGLEALKKKLLDIDDTFYDIPTVILKPAIIKIATDKPENVELTKVTATGKPGGAYANIKYEIAFTRPNGDAPAVHVAETLTLWVMGITEDMALTRQAVSEGLDHFWRTEWTSKMYTSEVKKAA